MNEQINNVDFWVDELTKDTDPEHFGFHENFISYMYDKKIYGFGNWMWNNGHNVGLFNLQTKVNTYCVPQWISHKTTTFKPTATDTRGYACQFRCNACDRTVSETYYMRPDQFDYNYCPFCGRPVESEDAE